MVWRNKRRGLPLLVYYGVAGVAKLVDVHVSGACAFTGMRVRVSPSALAGGYFDGNGVAFFYVVCLPQWDR